MCPFAKDKNAKHMPRFGQGKATRSAMGLYHSIGIPGTKLPSQNTKPFWVPRFLRLR
jgi:hypothetical protein